MTSTIKYRWVFFILIWAGVFYLTNRNSVTILDILDNRSRIEILRLDKEFWQRNSDNIANVLNQQKSLYQEIESLKIGQVALNDKIKQVVSESGVNDLSLEMDTKKQSQGNSIPVHISFMGPLKGGMEALSRIQSEFSFISFQKVSILPESQTGETKFDIFVNYRYKLVTREGQ
jgi:hypothetical protein